jgi:hypothetical protein
MTGVKQNNTDSLFNQPSFNQPTNFLKTETLLK